MTKLKIWWSNFWLTPVEKYLNNSTDLVDLEQRQQELQRKGIWL